MSLFELGFVKLHELLDLNTMNNSLVRSFMMVLRVN